MSRSVRVVLALVAAAICFSACSQHARVIPQKKMELIFQDLLMADQWATSDPSYQELTDTTLYYEPIFNKYGYTSFDYKKSVNHYLEDPAKFSKMLKRVALSLEARGAKLKGTQVEPEISIDEKHE